MKSSPLLKPLLLGLLVIAVLGALPRLWARASNPGPYQGPPLVMVTHPHPPQDNTLSLPGSTEAIQQTRINARAAGYVQRRFVDIGSKVRAGEVLAMIQAPELDRQVDQARAEVTRASASSEQAAAEVSRSQAGVAEAQAAVAHARARLLQSQATARSNQARLDQAVFALSNRKADRTRFQSQQQLAAVTWSRWKSLVEQGAVPRQDADERRSQYEVSSAQLRSGQLSVKEAEANVDSARAQLIASQADVEAAQADLVSAQRGLEAAHAALSSTRHSAAASQAGLASNQANSEHYQALQRFERVVAPYAGVITSRNTEIGSLVQPGASTDGLFGIARIDIIKLRVRVPQAYAGWMKVGMRASVTVREFEHPYEGTVVKVAGGLDAATHTIETEVHVPNPKSELLPGMFAQVHFEMPLAKVLLVNSSCLLINGQGNLVGVLDDQDHIHYKPVQLGRDLGTEMEILDGLSPQDRVLANPNYALQDGMQVKVVTPTPTPKPSQSPRA